MGGGREAGRDLLKDGIPHGAIAWVNAGNAALRPLIFFRGSGCGHQDRPGVNGIRGLHVYGGREAKKRGVATARPCCAGWLQMLFPRGDAHLGD